MKRFSVLGLAALLMLVMAACGTAPATQNKPALQTGQETSNSQQTAAQQPPQTEQQPQTQQKTAKIAVYFTDSNLMEVKKEEQEITYEDELDKYRKAIQLLGRPTKKEHQPLWENFTYHSLQLEKGQLTIDASSKNEYNYGSSAEALAFEALEKTMFQFPEVKKIVILEDGKPVDSLMGHYDTSEPLTRK